MDTGVTALNFEYGKDGAKLIVVGLDGSRTSWRATAYAAGVARRSHSRLVVVHVAGTGALVGLTPQAASLSAAAEQEWSGDLRSEVLAAAERAGLDCVFEVREGEPAHAIEQAADDH